MYDFDEREVSQELVEKIKRAIGREFKVISDFRFLHESPDFRDLCMRTHMHSLTPSESDDIEWTWLQLAAALKSILEEFLPLSGRGRIATVMEFFLWVDKELARMYSPPDYEFEEISTGRISIDDIQSLFLELDSTDDRIYLLDSLLKDLYSTSGMELEIKKPSDKSNQAIVTKVWWKGGKYELDLSKEEETALVRILEFLLDNRAELLKFEVLTKAYPGFMKRADATPLIDPITNLFLPSTHDQDVAALSTETESDSPSAVFNDLAAECQNPDSKFFPIWSFLKDLDTQDGFLVWPNTSRGVGTPHLVRQYDLALLVHHLNLKSAFQFDIQDRIASYCKNNFVWENGNPVNNDKIRSWLRDERKNRKVEELRDSKITRLIRALYSLD